MLRKRFVAAVAAGAVLALAGCAGGDGGGSDDGDVEITVMSSSDWTDNGFTDVVDAFEAENPGITVKLEMYPYRQLLENIEVKLSSQSQDYDVISVDGPLVANYTVKGFLEPLDQYIPSDVQNESWIQSSIDAGTFDGQLMAAPQESSTGLLFYNKDLLDAAGIEAPGESPEDRWTWEKLVAEAEKVTADTNGDGQTDVFGFTFDQVGRVYQLQPLTESLGGKLLSDDGLKATGYFNSQESVQAAQFYSDLFNTWGVSPVISPEESPEYFNTGKVAFFVGGPWNLARFQDAGVNFGIAPHPYFEGGEPVTPTGSFHFGVSRFSQHKDAAAKFVEFFTVGEGADIWFDEWKGLPASTRLIEAIESDPAYEEFPQSIFRLGVNELTTSAVPRPSTPGFLEWESIANRAYEDIKNGADPKATLDQAAEEMDAQLAKYASVG